MGGLDVGGEKPHSLHSRLSAGSSEDRLQGFPLAQ